MRREIINEELIDHMNIGSKGLLPQQKQYRIVPTSHLVDHQWNQANNEVFPNSRQALATTTLNEMPILAYEDVIPRTNTQQIGFAPQALRRWRGQGRGLRPRDRSIPFNIAPIIIPTTMTRQIIRISPDILGGWVIETIDEMTLHKGIGHHLSRTNCLGTRRLHPTIEKFLLDGGKNLRAKDLGDSDNVGTT